MNGATALSASQCVELLQDAIADDAATAAAAARNVALRGAAAAVLPHPAVTEAALQLLAVHPAAVVSHIPDLISASPSDVSEAVEAFGALLPTDRRLLVPMLGALGELPLTRAQEAAARTTLRFALRTVDACDVPAVARALLRCARQMSAARAAVCALRSCSRDSGLSGAPLLATVVSEHARRRTPVGRALRAAAQPYPLATPLDVAVWLLCLQRSRAAFDTVGNAAADTVRAAVRSGALLNAAPLVDDMAAYVARDSPQGVVALVAAVMHAVPPASAPPELNATTRFLCRLMCACPQAAAPCVAQIARQAANGVDSLFPQLLVLAAVTVLPRGAPIANAASDCPLAAAVLAARQEDPDSGWGALMVRMRKGLVFGAQKDKLTALRLAYAAVACGNTKVLNEVVALINSTVPYVLTDSLPASLLHLTIQAVMLDALDSALVERLYEQRVAANVPEELFTLKKPADDKPLTVHIDLAAIGGMHPCAVAVVIGAGVALLCRKNYDVKAGRSVVSLVVSSTVLVPLACLPLYEAAQHISGIKQDSPVSDEEGDVSRDEDDDQDFRPSSAPCIDKVSKLTIHELENAIEGCITCIAALVAVINAASVSFPATWNILKIRHDTKLRFADGAYQDDLWALLDRMSELQLMFEAVTFGYSGEATQPDYDSEDEGDTQTVKLGGALRQRVEHALGANSCTDHAAAIPQQFPVLSLHAVLAVLVAIPDEKCLVEVETHGAILVQRDPELTRIEAFLLRRLFSEIRASTSTASESGANVGEDNEEASDKHSSLPFLADSEVDAILEGIKQGKYDMFLAPTESTPADDHPRKRRRSIQRDAWAPPLVTGESGMHVTRACRAALGTSSPGDDVLYTPQFAALLLDRAVTNCDVAVEKRRRLRAPADQLCTVNCAAAMSLRILAHILVTAGDDDNIVDIHPFVRSAGGFLLSRFGRSGQQNTELVAREGSEANIVDALSWVARISVDAATSTFAIDCLAILAEYGVVASGAFRELLAGAVERTHEYNEDALWDGAQLKQLVERSTQDWVARRRRAGAPPKAIDASIAQGPWLTLDAAPGGDAPLARHRLRQLFNGMAAHDAARESAARSESAVRSWESREEDGSIRAYEVDIGVVCAQAAQVGLNALRADAGESLDPTTVSLCHWWTRTAAAACKLLGDREALTIAALVAISRTVADAQLARYSHERTDVPALPPAALREMHGIGRAIGVLATLGRERGETLRSRSMAGALNARGRAAALRAKSAVPRLFETAEAASRTHGAYNKTFGKNGSTVSVAICDGVRAWRTRARTDTDHSNCRASQSDEEVDEIEIMQHGGVVINFGDAR